MTEEQMDALLSLYTYLCYLENENLIDDEEFKPFKYNLHRALSNLQLQDYLYNLYHFSKKCGEVNSFATFLQYGKKIGFLSQDFEDPLAWNKPNAQYHNYLNF